MENERCQTRSHAGMTRTYVCLFALILFGVYALTHLIAVAFQPGTQPLTASVASTLHGAKSTPAGILFLEPGFLRWLSISSVVALSVTITGLALASSAGYALSRSKFLGLAAASHAFITQLLPAGILVLLFIVGLIALGLFNSYLGVLIIYGVTALPFCIWQMKICYSAIPFALEEAPRIDGATRWTTFRLIILPCAARALLLTALFSFLTAWNEYIITGIRFPHAKLFALPYGLESALSNSTRWGMYVAGAFLVTVIVVLLSILSRFIFSGERSQAAGG